MAIRINEIRINQPSTDIDEYFELLGDPGESLAGLTYIVIGDAPGGESGIIEAVVPLDGYALNADGYFVVAEDTFTLGSADLTVSSTANVLNFENGDNVTHLLVRDFTGSIGDDLDTDNDGTLDAVPWTEIVDSVAVIDTVGSGNTVYSATTVGPDGGFAPVHVYRSPNGTGAFQIGAFDPIGGSDTPGAPNPQERTVTINEIQTDQPSTDNDEYFELFGDPLASLDGLTYLVIGDGAGGSGIVEAVIDLNGQSLGTAGFFVAAESTFTLGVADLTTTLNFENSDNVTHLLVEGFTGANGDDLDLDDDGVLDSTPWATLIDSVALIESDPPVGTEQVYSETRVGPNGSFVPAHVFRAPDGSGDFRIGAFDPAGGDDTPGAANDSGGPPPATNVVINEIRIDQPGGDNDEYLELFGDPLASLDGLTYLVIGDSTTGGSGVVEAIIDLTGQSLDADGFFVAAESSFTLGSADLTTTLNFENSDNVTHLLVEGFTGSSSDDLDTDDDGTLDITPWTTVIDSIALVETVGSGEQIYSEATIGPDGGFVPAHVFRLPDGTGDFQIGQFDPAGGDDTPGTGNGVAPPPPPPPPMAKIYEIQGAGHVSPFVLAAGQTVADFFDTLPANTFNVTGDAVTTSGVVTAVDSNGFFLQDPDGDGDIATSDAIFVFTRSSPGVNVGDFVEVSGTVAEFFPGDTDTRNLSTTQLTDATVLSSTAGGTLPSATVIGAGGRLPPNQSIDDDAFAAFEPTLDGIDFFESLEGMLVTGQDLVAVAGTNQFGEIFAVVDQGAGASGISDRGTLNISPDDFNPEKIQIDADSGILPGFDIPEVDVGALLGNVTGVVTYDFGNFQITPTAAFAPTASTLQAESTDLVGTDDKLTVATYNVLNLDPNDGDGDTDVADGRFEAIAAQIVNNLKSPDIIGLQEVQDNTGSQGGDGITSASETLQQLAEAIAAAGGPTYSVIDNTFITDGASGGQPGGNIRTAFLYNPDRVSLVDGSVQAIGSQALGEAFEGARLPLVATFEFNFQQVTVVNNHFSSKGGSAPILGIEQPFDARQEDLTVNGSLDERREQSQAVQDFVGTILGPDPNANVVVLGDLNEFEFVSPVTGLESAGLTNLVNSVAEDERYSFIFQGNSQQLDHILISDALGGSGGTATLTGSAEFDIVHVNAEFAATDGRASDHDPGVARLALPVENVAIVGDDRGNLLFGTAEDDIILGRGGNDVLFGKGGGDRLFGEDGRDTLFGGAGDDALSGGDDRDKLFGGDGDDTLSGDDDRDTLFGGDGNDDMSGGAGGDRMYGGRDNDVMRGGDDNDQIYGQRGDDELFGDGGEDRLNGGSGDDRLDGGSGDDVVRGGPGSDIFVFGVEGGNDTFLGFDLPDDDDDDDEDAWGGPVTDRIDLSEFGFTDVAQVAALIQDHGRGAVIRFDADTSITLVGVESEDVQAHLEVFILA